MNHTPGERLDSARGTSLAIASLVTCLAVASVYITQPILAEIAGAFGVSPTSARLAFSVASIAYAVSFFAVGPLSDHFSAGKMARAGLLAPAVSLMLAAHASTFEQLLVLLALAGAAVAAVPAAIFAMVPRIAPSGQIGAYFGAIIAASVVGITIGRSVTGILARMFGWSHAVTIVAAAMAVMAALSVVLDRGGDSSATKRMSIAAAYRNAGAMLADMRLLVLFAAGFLLFFGYLGVVTFLTLRLQAAPFFYNSGTIGAISLVGLSAVVGAPVSGWLAARTSPLVVACAALAVVAAAMGCLRVADNGILATSGLFMLFLGVFSCQPAVFLQIAQRAGSDRRGAASSLYLLTCLGAGSISSMLLGPVWTQSGWQGVTSIGMGSIVFAAMILIGDACLNQRQATAS